MLGSFKRKSEKVGIVGAIIGNPEIIILDEPFANLDPSTQIKLKNLIKELSKHDGVTFLISTMIFRIQQKFATEL